MSTRIYAVTQAGGAIIKLHVNIGRHKAPIYFNHDHLSVWICDPGVGTDVFVNDGGERTPWGVTETPRRSLLSCKPRETRKCGIGSLRRRWRISWPPSRKRLRETTSRPRLCAWPTPRWPPGLQFP